MSRENDILSVNAAVNLQLAQEAIRKHRRTKDLVTKLNRAVSTPPETVTEQVQRRIVENKMRVGTIRKSEWGD